MQGSRKVEAPEYFRSGDVAKLFSVNPKTVTRWANTGRLRALRTPGGHRRYLKSDINELLSKSWGMHSEEPGEA